MKKIDFDFLIVDEVQGLKYEKTLRCKFDTNIGQLFHTIQRKQKKQIIITYNHITLSKGMRLREVFSRFCQNQIHILEQNEPIPEMIVRHTIQQRQLMREKKLEEIQIKEETELIEEINRNKAESLYQEVGVQQNSGCQNCTTIKSTLEKYENTIENLLEENQSLQFKVKELQSINKILEKKSYLNAQQKIKNRS